MLALSQSDRLTEPRDASSVAAGTRSSVLIISDHDYRTARRANMHPIADALARLGHYVTFLSVRFSLLSRIKGDSRNGLWNRANAPEQHNGIECYLWRTPIHPFHSKKPLLGALARPLYRAYPRLPNRFIDEAMRNASFIIVESGLGALMLERARACNSTARIAYVASDELKTVGVHPFVQERLEQAGGIIDQVCLPSRQMAPGFAWAGDRRFFVPHGLHPPDFASDAGSPYTSAHNAVSVGSMLFDRDVFIHAAQRFPQIEFHVIGAGMTFDAPRNVHQYGEMPFRETLPYIRHASFGIAPYRKAPGCEYICDTSMKLMQYEHFGIPAVCPAFAAGGNPNRFGYAPGQPASIAGAIEAAMEKRGAIERKRFLTWDEVALRLLDPRGFADTAL